jgi:hypothetical protein
MSGTGVVNEKYKTLGIICIVCSLFAKYNYNYEVKEYEMDRACNTNGRRGKHIGY